MMTDTLPEGVTRLSDGSLQRTRLRFRGFVNADGRPWKDGDGERFEDHDEIPHPCLVASASDDVDEIERKRALAISRSYDFYHPRLGWLAYGRKREQEWPENLGSGVVQYQRRRRPVPAVEQSGVIAPVEASVSESDPSEGEPDDSLVGAAVRRGPGRPRKEES